MKASTRSRYSCTYRKIFFLLSLADLCFVFCSFNRSLGFESVETLQTLAHGEVLWMFKSANLCGHCLRCQMLERTKRTSPIQRTESLVCECSFNFGSGPRSLNVPVILEMGGKERENGLSPHSWWSVRDAK